MKKYNLLLIALVAIIFSCGKDKDDPAPTKKQMLTNGFSKNWNMTKMEPEDLIGECGPDSDRAKDNTWTFKSTVNSYLIMVQLR
jgi:hypothetical protein